ncbi:hypothetical protein HanRHA438_Chr00c02g0843581 [Helianthus annuus]|nr:hypothetical protein HanRHA438_Chr00c02g0843581 [Helianthus annuus]
MVMWFHMATVSMQPWRIYPLCLIVYKSEPHNRFITSTTVLVYICYVFGFAATLTSWHLLVTFCSLHVALWMKFFEHKPFDSRAVMGFGILNGISIGLLNLSLGFNSVGFYQMTKLAIIPCTVLLETLFFSKQFRLNLLVVVSHRTLRRCYILRC